MADTPSEKKKPPIKTIVVVLGMLIVEAVAVVAVMTMIGGPSPVQGAELVGMDRANLDELHEIPVLREKFTNDSRGRVWIYDTEVIVRVKERHLAGVQADLERKQALIRTGVGKIFSAAQPSTFTEPGREMLSRQILEFLNGDGLIEPDPDGEPRVQEVLIPSCLGFPADY